MEIKRKTRKNIKLVIIDARQVMHRAYTASECLASFKDTDQAFFEKFPVPRITSRFALHRGIGAAKVGGEGGDGTLDCTVGRESCCGF